MDSAASAERNAGIEWPTLALIGFLYAAWLALTWAHASIPAWLWLPLAGWVGAWWGSAQHEALHGHPTRNRRLNAALATPPFWLWLPFERYRQMHLRHHRDERLTDPLDDPESRYWTASGWRELGPIGRRLVALQSTLAGRLIIGPAWSIWRFWSAEACALLSGDRERARIWLWHTVWTALTLAWALAVCGVPFWLCGLGFVYLGTALTLFRSFAEHRAHDAVEKRTAIVENSAIFGLLFLHNNLHAAHHRWPGVAWYRLPGLYRAHREALIRDNGGLVYAGYREVVRRFFLSAHDQPVHPLGRAPGAARTQAGRQ